MSAPSTASALALCALGLAAACEPRSVEARSTGRSDPRLEAVLARYEGDEARRPNVLLISLDSVRRDFLGCYGHRPRHAPDSSPSPNVDALAAAGVVFEDFYASSSWTLPSHMALMSGEPDVVHSVDDPLFALDTGRPTLAAILQRAGWATAGFYSGGFLHERYGFGRGFDEYAAAFGPAVAALHDEQSEWFRRVEEAAVRGDFAAVDEFRARAVALDQAVHRATHRDRSSDVVTDGALAAVRRAADAERPWFVFAHYFDPHYDYDPPGEFATRFDPDYQGAIDGVRFFQNPGIGVVRRDDPDPSQRTQQCSDRDLEHVQALYEGEIAWTDSQVGRLLDGLRDLGEFENTLIVVVSDHGEEFFEHGGIGHRSSLLEEQVAVPCIVRLPGDAHAGVRVGGLTTHADVLATVLSVVDLPALPEVYSRDMMSLVTRSEPSRSLLTRLVEYHPVADRGGAPIARNRVTDMFRSGSIKIFRVRQWPEATPDCPPDRAERVRASAAQARAHDIALQWIDVERFPDEPLSAFSTEFDDPAATAALREFQTLFGRLTDEMPAVTLSHGGSVPWILRGQVGWREGIQRARSRLRFPPPGR